MAKNKKTYKIKAFIDTEIEVYFTREKYTEFLKKHKQEDIQLEHLAGQAIWLEYKAKGLNVFAIAIFEDKASTCIHEATHMVENIMERYSINDREFKAYMTEYISCQLFDLCAIHFKGV